MVCSLNQGKNKILTGISAGEGRQPAKNHNGCK
jgi:hypothetical protein